jgi:phage nucleotide-binding protein
MKLFNTQDAQFKPSVVMLVYGEGGVGKTTFTSTAPKPVLADCEGGAKYFGLRGIKIDVAQIEKWNDMKEFFEIAKSPLYETVIIDPIGELMEKLKNYMVAQNDSKLVQKDGSPTAAGWGWLKQTMRNYLKLLRDSGKHVILVAHLEEAKDEDRLVKRPKVQTKLSDEIVNMVDIVGYMTVVQQDGETKRIIIVDPGNDKYTAKDRTGQLGKIIEPDFTKIIAACQGTETFAWSKPQVAKKEKKQDDPKLGDVKEGIAVAETELNRMAENVAADPGGEDALDKALGPKVAKVEPPAPPKKLNNPHLQAAKEKMMQAQGKP